MDTLAAFRSVDFDWTRQLRSVWRDPPYHVPSLHRDRVDDLVDYFTRKTHDADPANEPLGNVIVGPAGYGKTHLIGQLRRRIWEAGGWFVLLDFVGITDFWSSVALGFLNSLQVRMTDGRTQYDRLVLEIASLLGIHQEMIEIANRWRERPRDLVTELAGLFVRSLARLHRHETGAHRNIVTALILLISEDLDCHSIAHAWLQGMNLDPEVVKPLGLFGENSAIKVVEGLSWIMSLTHPTLIAIDQIDAIVSASNARVRAANSGAEEERQEAQSIVESLALGLMDLHEKKRRAVTVVSCLEATWDVLRNKASVAVTDRYNSPINLRALPSVEVAAALVTARLSQAYEAGGFRPPYPSWPFPASAFDTAIDFSPRQLLKACENHRLRCIAEGKVTEYRTFTEALPGLEPPKPDQHGLDHVYDEDRTAAEVAGLMDVEGEDKLQALLDTTMRLFEKHLALPDDIEVDVQRDPDQKRPSLHARLSFTFHDEGDREQHYCFRILGHANAIAFQSRLKAAMTASGIDTALKFRHLFVLRQGEPPGGPKTKALVEQFLKAGGCFILLTDEDLRAFVALRALAQRNPGGFEAWLRARKPLFDTPLFKAVGLAPPAFLPPGPHPKGGPTSGPPLPDDSQSPDTKPRSPATRAPSSDAVMQGRDAAKPHDGLVVPPCETQTETLPLPKLAIREIPLGHRYERGAAGAAVTLAADLLPRHVAILAGSGSGKTVLLRRLVEEAALLGIPAVVVDINNDLARLGDPWPHAPEAWTAADAAKATAYGRNVDVAIWTPGRNSGRPISLALLPDFASLRENEDECAQAIEMARATLAPYIGTKGASAKLREGVLADALRSFARAGGGGLEQLIDTLSDLPDDVSHIDDAPKLASAIANQLRAAVATDPLLQSRSAALDPDVLFRAGPGKIRISVINLSGLASDEARQSFVNQLQMSLFTWIKRHPSPTGRLYVLDEAQNFAPSKTATPCKESTVSLAAQARKYGLGMIFATQTPKGIDNTIISNCTTHFYGRMSSPATIEATRELMAAKGGSGEDIGRLTRGEFYFSTESVQRPMRIRTPLCLSWHPANPLTTEEVVAKARASL